MPEDELIQAILAVQSGDMEQARITLSAILRQDPKNADAWRWMAVAMEDSAKREQCWKRVLSLKPGDTQAMKALGLRTPGEVSRPQQATSEATGETVYLRGGNLVVTSTRIAIGGKTYAAKHITSVQMVQLHNEARIWGIGIAALGVLSVLSALGALLLPLLSEAGSSAGAWVVVVGCAVIGIILLVIGAGLARFSKTKYVVRLASASGEVDALRSTDKELITTVVEAITTAITG